MKSGNYLYEEWNHRFAGTSKKLFWDVVPRTNLELGAAGLAWG